MRAALTPARTDDSVAFLMDRAKHTIDEAEHRAESFDEMVARIARDQLKRKLDALSYDDLVAGMHSVTQAQHGPALRAAFKESAEALGDFVMSAIVHQIGLDAEIEAVKIAEAIAKATNA